MEKYFNFINRFISLILIAGVCEMHVSATSIYFKTDVGTRLPSCNIRPFFISKLGTTGNDHDQ